jgi:hypothetical protein
MDVVDDIQSGIPFAEALESLFQNITIELMSSKLLQYVLSRPNPLQSQQTKLTKARKTKHLLTLRTTRN